MEEHNFTFAKTGRYYTSTVFNKDLKEVWVVLHGYRQLAKFFLNKFGAELPSDILLVAPEGMHRFYLNGTSGRVGASWMTKEAREQDIQDYIAYLDLVLTEILKGLSEKKSSITKVNVLGFSQGAATAVRWYTASKLKLDDLVLWGGALPVDVDYKHNLEKLNSSNLKVLIGDQDEFIQQSKVVDLEKFLHDHELRYTLHLYQGKHDIYPNVFRSLF